MKTTPLLLALLLGGCAVRQVPISPALQPMVDSDTPTAKGQVVALVMDERVASWRRDRDFSLTQRESYESGHHFIRSLLAQLRARGLSVLQVESTAQARELGAPFTVIPDSPDVSVFRPKGLLDFSFLGSLNRIKVSYSAQVLKSGSKVPQRVTGTGARTASFFWSNAILQSLALNALGVAVSVAIYGLWLGVVAVTQVLLIRNGENFTPLQFLDRITPPLEVAIAVFLADMLVSQFTAQLVPRVINPLVDIFVNEPRWQVMVQGAHDSAVEELANEVTAKITALAAPPVRGAK